MGGPQDPDPHWILTSYRAQDLGPLVLHQSRPHTSCPGLLPRHLSTAPPVGFALPSSLPAHLGWRLHLLPRGQPRPSTS